MDKSMWCSTQEWVLVYKKDSVWDKKVEKYFNACNWIFF